MQRSTKLSLFLLVQLLCTIHPTSAIGGWQTICIFFNRWSEERGIQNSSKASTAIPKSPQERIASAPNDDSSDTIIEEVSNNGRTPSQNKKHVGEVKMTSSRKRTVVSMPTTPAFTRGRRGGSTVRLDEDDLATITTVGRSPFL
ncbi:predicted protein [Thalassiosira pseudonana CCMP1335]|uniref:Secreted protein n=1 Tax=Thalassiosira pseudonana TaxID=35128 RepID=B8C4P9_THAPS|nr:predicted protein [Thalassiosira pseudonana CCMP1335]EED91764.1 predicted protein [Thalassiosira pseudonana CCMP1335]|eukprot:scaffold2031_cov185-Alexandrium_tamarense.AAC.2